MTSAWQHRIRFRALPGSKNKVQAIIHQCPLRCQSHRTVNGWTAPPTPALGSGKAVKGESAQSGETMTCRWRGCSRPSSAAYLLQACRGCSTTASRLTALRLKRLATSYNCRLSHAPSPAQERCRNEVRFPHCHIRALCSHPLAWTGVFARCTSEGTRREGDAHPNREMGRLFRTYEYRKSAPVLGLQGSHERLGPLPRKRVAPGRPMGQGGASRKARLRAQENGALSNDREPKMSRPVTSARRRHVTRPCHDAKSYSCGARSRRCHTLT
jgi:hypothetical protein